jgi:ketosteroid isomerase-like protein
MQGQEEAQRRITAAGKAWRDQIAARDKAALARKMAGQMKFGSQVGDHEI